jgi:hypothetical protein
MSNPQVVSIDQLRSLAFGSITGTYAAVGTALANQTRLICFTNTTDADVLVSIDGTNNYLIVPAGSFKLFDLCTNRLNSSQSWVFQPGTQFYVKTAGSPSKGAFYIEALWGGTSSGATFQDL